MLVSRKWTSKTLKQHRADRAAVVREALDTAGITPPEIERMSAEVEAGDGLPRFVWTPAVQDPRRYASVIVATVAERMRWRAEYAAAKQAVDSDSTKPP